MGACRYNFQDSVRDCGGRSANETKCIVNKTKNVYPLIVSACFVFEFECRGDDMFSPSISHFVSLCRHAVPLCGCFISLLIISFSVIKRLNGTETLRAARYYF